MPSYIRSNSYHPIQDEPLDALLVTLVALSRPLHAKDIF